jgi:hypothetical protein
MQCVRPNREIVAKAPVASQQISVFEAADRTPGMTRTSFSAKFRPALLVKASTPSRNVDALVWAFSDLLVEPEPGAAMIEFYRLRAREAAEKKAAAEAVPRHPAT